MNEFHLTPDSDDDRLRVQARKLFLPSRPITIREALRGRERQLARTLEALETPGRSVFVFGQRGVGKTSLAQTAAYLFNSSEVDPVLLACHPRSTFGEIVTQVVRKLAATGGRKNIKQTTTETKLSLGFGPAVATFLKKIEEKPDEHLTRLDPNLAVDLFNAACPSHLAGKLVVLVDELDTIGDDSV